MNHSYLLCIVDLAEVEADLTPTPRYNTAVLQDMIQCKHTEHVLQHIQDSQGVRDGIVLLKVWLHQRELDLVINNNFNFVYV